MRQRPDPGRTGNSHPRSTTWPAAATQGHLGCRIGLIAYSPRGPGFLPGAITSPDDFAADDFRRTDPRFQGENFARNLAVVDEVRRIAMLFGS